MRAESKSSVADKNTLSTQGVKATLRLLVVDDDASLRSRLVALLSQRSAPAVAMSAADVPSALDALFTRHPDLVVANLALPGHPRGGLRVVLDAVSVGVPVVAVGDAIAPSVAMRLSELRVACVSKGCSAATLLSAVDRALSMPTHPTPARAPATDARAFFGSV